MKWFTDEWEDSYAELLYDLTDEEEEEDETAMYFDVPLHPVKTEIERRTR